MAEFARKARRKYGWLGGYAETEVMPGLVNRGLYECREQSGFWKITRPGEVARSELERNLARHSRERLSLWGDDDPAQALAFLAIAGLSPPTHRRASSRPPTSPRTAQIESDAYVGAEGGAAGGDTEAAWGATLPYLGPGAFDFGVLDGLNSVLSAIDAAVSSGGGGDSGRGEGS